MRYQIDVILTTRVLVLEWMESVAQSGGLGWPLVSLSSCFLEGKIKIIVGDYGDDNGDDCDDICVSRSSVAASVFLLIQ